MRSTALIAGLFCSIASSLPLGVAWGQDARSQSEAINAKPIGKVVTVSGRATIEHASAVILQAKLSNDGVQPATVDDPVFQNDVIQTAPDAAVGIVFGDGTTFNMSKNARMEINEFIYNAKGAPNSTLFSLTSGTFTFIAGKAANTGSMRVNTPVGTMGIRGTVPHVEILDDGRVKFATLIEEGKRRNVQPAPASSSRTEIEAPSSPAFSQAKKIWDRISKICRGC